MDAPFLPGLELSARLYREAVLPLLREHYGDLPHTAARVGSGSEVLGFDTPRSADHEWGPRLQIFLAPNDVHARATEIVSLLAERLPKTFLGYPTNFVPADNEHIRRMQVTDGPVYHRAEVTDLHTWFTHQLGFDPRHGITISDWLAIPTQTLAEVTGGAVFHDGLAELVPTRRLLAWYPNDVWRYVLASQWQRVAHEEAFVGRCGEVGDELGSAVVAARLVRELMRLCLLLHRRYPPYSKWLGSTFAQLPCATRLIPTFRAAIAATTWRRREEHLADAYKGVATVHNELGLTDPVDPHVRPYHGRPYQVLHAERFVSALVVGITDEQLRRSPLIGGIDQYVDNTDVLCDRALTAQLGAAL